MTDDSASKNNRHWLWRLNSPWPKLLLISLVVSLAASWTTFVALRLYAGYRTELEWTRFRDDVQDAQQITRSTLDSMERRVHDLEMTVYAVLEPRSAQVPKVIVPRSPAELWQRQRDEELRRRILQLERWRMEVDAQK